MPALQSVTVSDRATPSPVTHSFTPRDVKAGVGLVVANPGVAVAETRLTVAMRRSGARFKGELRIAIPVTATETIGGVERIIVLRTNYVDVSVNFADTSTLQERNNAVGMVVSALGVDKTLVNDALIKCEGVYGA